MVQSSYWEEGSKYQWIFCAKDNSPLDKLQERVSVDAIQFSINDEPVNLGIKRVNGTIYSGNYVGLCRLKSINGKRLTSYDGREVILRIEPRFDISVVEMLNALREDDEFERYLAPQTSRINETDKEIEDLKNNELFYFFDNEDPIYVRDIKIKTTGCYVYYKPVINAAKMVLNEITLEANGESALTSYVVPYAVSMSKLFEMYVRAYLKRAGIKSYLSNAEGIHILKYDYKSKVLSQNARVYSNYIGGNVKPVIILFNPQTNKYVVFDVKYKNLLHGKTARADRLQVLAYALLYNCENVGIIFPTLDGTENVYYERNEIENVEQRQRYYNQMEIEIDSNWEYVVRHKETQDTVPLLQYIEELLV